MIVEELLLELVSLLELGLVVDMEDWEVVEELGLVQELVWIFVFLLEGAPNVDSVADKENEEMNDGSGGEYVGEGLI